MPRRRRRSEPYGAELAPGKYPGDDAILTKIQLARWLQVHERTIQRLVYQEGLPVLALGVRTPRFLAREVFDWLRRDRGNDVAEIAR